jgi:3-oxoacyl-[acyl-carrier-protein] synthase III
MTAAILEGLGTAVPTRVMTNDDFAAYLDTSDEWIRSRTGIAERRFAESDIATSDLAVDAGAAAIKSAGGGEVDIVILATTTPDRVVPGTAPEVASRLGLPNVAAFDVNGACSGFVYGLATGSAFIAGGLAKRVLMIGADTLSRIIDLDDRNTAVLLADGAGAVVLRAGDPDELGAVGPFDLGSDGEQGDLLHVPAGGSRRPASTETLAERAHALRMDGREVYRRAVVGMAASCQRVLDAVGLRTEDIDWVVGHQANARILEATASRLGVLPERCVINIDRYGNTSAASIPLALADMPARPGDRVMLTAFGAGLTWGSTLVRWPDLQPA